ncbi:MAG: orotidine 5'-phosphate decarboxylase [Candidatus Peribacteraceae bacterium]|nr:orotidine 5'-phosphate decarboxylase [Candidatus Peribacteraceae bacterium]
MSIIKMNRSVIPACDVSTLEMLEKLVSETCNVKGIGAYKIGFELVIPFGMRNVIDVIRKHTDLPIIYDHQKSGTDIPATGAKFMRACKGVDAVIIFPQAGPETEKEWIKAAKNEGMEIIVGGEMTHPGYLEKDNGFILDSAPKRIYEIAASLGVTNFVVPGNKPDKILEYKEFLESKGVKPVFYSPGLVAQGGDLTDSAKAAGENWHAIVGRGIYQAKNMQKSAEEITKKII